MRLEGGVEVWQERGDVRRKVVFESFVSFSKKV